jgi:hypothetical protein
MTFWEELNYAMKEYNNDGYYVGINYDLYDSQSTNSAVCVNI